MKDRIVNDGTMCPVNTAKRPGILMSHTCVDWIFLQSSKLIVRGDAMTCLLSTLAPSMMNLEVVPLSVMAWLAAIVRVFEYCCTRLQKIAQATTAIGVGACVVFNRFDQLEVITVAAWSSTQDDVLSEVGSKKLEVAENKLLHLCANGKISAPHCQKFRVIGRTDLCIPLVQGSYPAAMN
jgi:hypothetical protein